MKQAAVVLAAVVAACHPSPAASDAGAGRGLEALAPGTTATSASPGGRAPAGDPCGAHRDKASCEADLRCEGLPYRGESVVACKTDARCFASNCPSPGCISRCEVLDAAACAKQAPRCVPAGGGCARREPCGPRRPAPAR